MKQTLKSIIESIKTFNSQAKYIETCDFCNNRFIYTKDEQYNNVIKCPYCGHVQNILYEKPYNLTLHISSDCKYEDDSFKV